MAGHGPKVVLPHVDDGDHVLDDTYSSLVIAKSEPVGAGLPNAMLRVNPIIIFVRIIFDLPVHRRGPCPPAEHELRSKQDHAGGAAVPSFKNDGAERE